MSRKGIDPLFADFARNVRGMNIETDDDIVLERQTLEEVQRLQRELEGDEEQFTLHPVTPPPIKEPTTVVGTLQTRASRRRRTSGEGSRPVTAPQAVESIIRQSSVKPQTSGSFFPASSELSPRSMKLKLLDTMMNNALNNRERASTEIKSRACTQRSSELDKLEKEHQVSLEQLNLWFESKKSSLETNRRQQEKLQSLTNTVNQHSQAMESLSQQFMRDKGYSIELKENELLAKETLLSQRESRILAAASLLENDKQRLASRQQFATELESQRKGQFLKETLAIQQDKAKLEGLHTEIKLKHRKHKQRLAVEGQKLEMVQESTERTQRNQGQELLAKDSALAIKNSQLQTRRNEELDQISLAKSQLLQELAQVDSFRRNVSSYRAELSRRLDDAEELQQKSDCDRAALSAQSTELEAEKSDFEFEAKKIHDVSVRVSKETEEIISVKKELESEHHSLDNEKCQLLMAIASCKEEKNRLLQQQQALFSQMKTYESLRNDSPFVHIPQLTLELPKQPVPLRRPPTFSTRITPAFRADEYLKDLEDFTRDRSAFQQYLMQESEVLLQSRIAHETGLTKSLLGSVRRQDPVAFGESLSVKPFSWSLSNSR